MSPQTLVRIDPRDYQVRLDQAKEHRASRITGDSALCWQLRSKAQWYSFL